jgi:Mn2+/Fe2+ NRAMP family transporter
VPYNLFLGSGLARGQNLRDIRLGLGVAVPLGGLISMAVLVTGTAVSGRFTYDGLAAALGSRLGAWSTWFFAFGLFCAGLSSAVTAPLASAISVQSLATDRKTWRDNSTRYRSIWIGVLLFGLVFGLSGVRPIPAIILAQAVNGILLPGVAVFLLIAVNDPGLMGKDKVAGPLANTVMGLSCLVAMLLGTAGIVRAVSGALGLRQPGQLWVFVGGLAAAVLAAVPVVHRILRSRKQS